MGIPSTAFQSDELYIEYEFEEVLFRCRREQTGFRYFRKFYRDVHEAEIRHDSKLFCEARCSGVLTTAERYVSGGPPVADPTAVSFSAMAVRRQRIRPYWLSVMHLSYTCSGDIEVGVDGRLEVIKAAASVKELLERVVSDINSEPCLRVTSGEGTLVTVSKESKDYEYGLRLELKKRELTVVSESSYYHGRSSP